jgi:hypothetical protein
VNCENPWTPRRAITRCLWPFIILGTSAAVAAEIPSRPIRTQPPNFAFAQCANACQLQQDYVASLCLTADNPNKPYGTRPPNCGDLGRGDYEACLKTCPDDRPDETSP